jgi:hypothetical protein
VQSGVKFVDHASTGYVPAVAEGAVGAAHPGRQGSQDTLHTSLL